MILKSAGLMPIFAVVASVIVATAIGSLMVNPGGDPDSFSGCFARSKYGPSTLKVVNSGRFYLLFEVRDEILMPLVSPQADSPLMMRRVEAATLRSEVGQYFGDSVELMAEVLVNEESILKGPAVIKLQTASASLDLVPTDYVWVGEQTFPLFPRQCDDLVTS